MLKYTVIDFLIQEIKSSRGLRERTGEKRKWGTLKQLSTRDMEKQEVLLKMMTTLGFDILLW